MDLGALMEMQQKQHKLEDRQWVSAAWDSTGKTFLRGVNKCMPGQIEPLHLYSRDIQSSYCASGARENKASLLVTDNTDALCHITCVSTLSIP